MTLTGAPARLRPLPRLLLLTEAAVSGAAAGACVLAWGWQWPAAIRAAFARESSATSGFCF